jgi:hypothetical protein
VVAVRLPAAEGWRTLVAEGELRDCLEAEAVLRAGEKVLHVRGLETERAAREAAPATIERDAAVSGVARGSGGREGALGDEAILLDHADGKLLHIRRDAAVLLDADARATALAEDEDVVKVARRVAADASGVHHLGHDW